MIKFLEIVEILGKLNAEWLFSKFLNIRYIGSSVKPVGNWFKTWNFKVKKNTFFYFKDRELLDLATTEVCVHSVSRLKID